MFIVEILKIINGYKEENKNDLLFSLQINIIWIPYNSK